VKPLDRWLSRGKKVVVGERELILMPLPLSALVDVGDWLEENCNEVVQEAIHLAEGGVNPLSLVYRVILRADTAEICLRLFTRKKPDGTLVNEGLTKEFFFDSLDVPTAHNIFNAFVEINEIDGLLKNLQSLPVVREVLTSMGSTFGLPFLNILQQSTGSTQKTSEGSQSHRSTGTLTEPSSEKQEGGTLEITEEMTTPMPPSLGKERVN